tara:strand:+ start:191 stop:487 length:297 start_codon:yes stop_codon:yes gene_type:complete
MKFVIEKKLSCTLDTLAKCSSDIYEKIGSKLGDNIIGDNYHISILHKQNNHKIWIFLYDKIGRHESEAQGKNIYQNSSLIKKFIGTKPTLNEIKKVLE